MISVAGSARSSPVAPPPIRMRRLGPDDNEGSSVPPRVAIGTAAVRPSPLPIAGPRLGPALVARWLHGPVIFPMPVMTASAAWTAAHCPLEAGRDRSATGSQRRTAHDGRGQHQAGSGAGLAVRLAARSPSRACERSTALADATVVASDRSVPRPLRWPGATTAHQRLQPHRSVLNFTLVSGSPASSGWRHRSSAWLRRSIHAHAPRPSTWRIL